MGELVEVALEGPGVDTHTWLIWTSAGTTAAGVDEESRERPLAITQ